MRETITPKEVVLDYEKYEFIASYMDAMRQEIAEANGTLDQVWEALDTFVDLESQEDLVTRENNIQLRFKQYRRFLLNICKIVKREVEDEA